MRQSPTQRKGLNDGVIDASGTCFDVFGAECVNSAALTATDRRSFRVFIYEVLPARPLAEFPVAYSFRAYNRARRLIVVLVVQWTR